MMDKTLRLAAFLNINFKNLDLLKQAMVHCSYINENPGFTTGNNERLEFLGDAVLEIVITEYLYREFPTHDEGDLTNWRSSLVNSRMLSKIAEDIKLEDFVYLSKGEEKDGNEKAKQFIMANAVEALIGAIYLDQGMQVVTQFIKTHIIVKLNNIISNKLYFDPKSKFQEWAQNKVGVTPHYAVFSHTGPDHARIFEVGVYIGKELVASGRGESKQEAQMQAAENALRIKNNG